MPKMLRLLLSIGVTVCYSDVILGIRMALMPTASNESVNSSTGSSGADCPLDLGLLVELSAVRVLGTPGDGDTHGCRGVVE